MPVQRKSPAESRRSHDPSFDFLDAYDNRTWSNDDGALLGQLEAMREGIVVPAIHDELMQQAVNRALSAT
ncbi:MAG: hypothetical protein ACHP7M_12490 [Burkholderiales bacterium]